ncbi:MAG: hypothetical protein HYV59_08420 [Planctomycetes bacterium]|nr:hypothetical protein [Planctomycetota bacterium]
MKIVLNRKFTKRGMAYVEATLDGRPIRWGACLSYAVTGLKTQPKDGICFISEKHIEATVKKGPFHKKFIIPPLNFGQSLKEFEESFYQRVAIYKEVKKWLEIPFCNDSVTIEI